MTAPFGAYGKMPGLGDFFRAGLPRAFVEPWDAWLQQTILALRDAMGGAWNNAYLSAPIWRFSLGPGLAGPEAVSGVLMASVDRVGRQFPLTLAATLPGAASALANHAAATHVFEELEAIALDALEDDMTREALAERLAGLGTPTAAPTRVATTANTLTVRGAQPFAALAAGRLSAFRAASIWSADLPDDPRLMICDGLPGPAQARGLIDLAAPVWQSESAP